MVIHRLGRITPVSFTTVEGPVGDDRGLSMGEELPGRDAAASVQV